MKQVIEVTISKTYRFTVQGIASVRDVNMAKKIAKTYMTNEIANTGINNSFSIYSSTHSEDNLKDITIS